MARQEDRIDKALRDDLAAIKLVMVDARLRAKLARQARDRWAKGRAAKARRRESREASKLGIGRVGDTLPAGYYTAKLIDPKLSLEAIQQGEVDKQQARQERKRQQNRKQYQARKLAKLNQRLAALGLPLVDDPIREDKPAQGKKASRQARQQPKRPMTIAWDRVGSE